MSLQGTLGGLDGPSGRGVGRRTGGMTLANVIWRIRNQPTPPEDAVERHLAENGFVDLELFTYDTFPIYSHEAWRGRIRASAGVGGVGDRGARASGVPAVFWFLERENGFSS